MIKALFKDTEVLFKDSSISRYGQSYIYINIMQYLLNYKKIGMIKRSKQLWM